MIKHVAVCENCKVEEPARIVYGIISEYKPPMGWKIYEGNDFCTATCVADYINKTTNHAMYIDGGVSSRNS